MNKKYGKILLIMIIIFQLAVPITLIVAKQIKRNNIEKYGKDIKISVESVHMDDNTIYIESSQLGELDYSYKYATFTQGDDGYCYNRCTDEKPEDKVYLNIGNYDGWSWSFIPYRNSGVDLKTLGLENVGYYNIYNYYIESENILNGYIKGPSTEAYMIMRIYDGEFEIKEVYVGGVALKEFLEKTQSREINPDRFEYCYDYEDYEDYDDWDEEYYDYKTEDVTEPVTSEAA